MATLLEKLIEEYKETLSTESLKAFELMSKEQQIILVNAYNIEKDKTKK